MCDRGSTRVLLSDESFFELIVKFSRHFRRFEEFDIIQKERRHYLELLSSIWYGKSHDFIISLEENCGNRCHNIFLSRVPSHRYRLLTSDMALLHAKESEIEVIVSEYPQLVRQYVPMQPTFKVDADLVLYKSSRSGMSLAVILAPLSADEVDEVLDEVEIITKQVDGGIEWSNLPPRKEPFDIQWPLMVRIVDHTKAENVLSLLSRMREVLWIEQKHDIHTSNRWVAGVCQSGVYTNQPISQASLTGAGEIIGVSDTGLDMNSAYFYDPSYPSVPYDTVNSQHRKVVTYISTYGDKIDDSDGHGTHICGTAAGSCYTDDTNCRAFNGVAPDAKIAFLDIGKTSYGGLSPPNSLDTGLFQPLYQAGARIFSNSWGASQDNSYNYMSADSDRFMWNYPDSLILYAAGNNGTGSDTTDNGAYTIAAPSTMKSGIAVGASLNDYNSFVTYGGGSGAGVSSYQSVDSLAAFSSRGPTKDGRMKPDIVAPGWWTASAGSLYTGSNSYGNSGSGSDFTHCKLRILRGTSMSTPAVAASAALIRQYFREGYYPSGSSSSNSKNDGDAFIPSGALLKAMLVHSTELLSRIVNVDYKGYYSMGDLSGPDSNQGYGRVKLDNVLRFNDGDDDSSAVSLFVVGAAEESHPLYRRMRSGEYHEYSFSTPSKRSSTMTITVTMAYTDYPAAYGAAVPLINNLDMIIYLAATGSSATSASDKTEETSVTAYVSETVVYTEGSNGDDDLPYETYYPLDYDGSQSKLNPVEKIVLQNPKLDSTYRVRVYAKGSLSSAQPYALVISGSFQDFESAVDAGLRGKVTRVWRSMTDRVYGTPLGISFLIIAIAVFICILYRAFNCSSRRQRRHTTTTTYIVR